MQQFAAHARVQMNDLAFPARLGTFLKLDAFSEDFERVSLTGTFFGCEWKMCESCKRRSQSSTFVNALVRMSALCAADSMC